jgi:hypothetical protein
VKKIVPFRFITTTDLTGDKKRTKKLVAFCGELEGIWVSQRRTADWSVGASVNLYNGVKKYFKYTGNIRKHRRHKQSAWKTILNHYLKEGKRFANGEIGPG